MHHDSGHHLQIIRAGVEIGVPAVRVHRALTEELDGWLADAAAVDIDAGAYDFWGRTCSRPGTTMPAGTRSSSMRPTGCCASCGTSAAPTPR